GVRLVAADRIAEAGEALRRGVGQLAGAAGAVAIADDDVGAEASTAATHGRGHRVAVEKDGEAESVVGLNDELAQRTVIRLVHAVDAGEAFLDVQRARVDLLALGDDAGDRAEPA